MATSGKIEPLIKIDPKVIFNEEKIAKVEWRINNAFMADLFLMLANSNVGTMTAREVEERHEEKTLQLGPTLENVHDELLEGLIDRTFAIQLRRNLIPPAPAVLQGAELKVEFISILAQAQKLVGTVSVQRFAEFVNGVANFDPSAIDKYETDKNIDHMAGLLGVTPELVRSDEDAAAIRERREQERAAEAQAAQAAAARDASQAAKNLGETEVGGEPALDQLLSAQGAA
jgi:hypothetical protein